ncbi:transcriptional repressor [Vibrio sp. DW001]|uniref:Fur family transcriptional regulator n=1 Tax=Vibrio sp. DW001 TaxID=2912315 RepID=UPI0023B080D8|nr:transcriptional repressor [Vibrio sp. DW001]WED25766.1 transcriptional repressor [Vibrio sp. DW001]
MRDNEAVIQHAEKSCKAHGKLLTEKRKLVLRALVQSNKELSAYELADYCKEHFGQNIKAMSVYRILDFLETEHLAHKINVSNKYIACSHILCEHEHGIAQFLICSECGRISELTTGSTVVTELQSHARQEGFTMTKPQLEISCVCDDCAK